MVVPPIPEEKYFVHVCYTVIFTIAINWISLTLLFSENKSLMYDMAINDFPFLYKPSPIVVGAGQFFVTALFLLPFCIRDFSRNVFSSIGSVLLPGISYACNILSALNLFYFFKPPSYFQTRSFSIAIAFFLSFFTRLFYNFPDTIIAISFVICGNLISFDNDVDIHFQYFIFGLASSIASVISQFGIRRAIAQFRRKIILLSFSLNLVAFLYTFPYIFSSDNLSTIRNPNFTILPFLGHLVLSGLLAALSNVSCCVILYFSSPLHYVTLCAARHSLLVIAHAFLNPIDNYITHLGLFGHVLTICSAIVAMVFHLQRLKQKAIVPWQFPHYLGRLLGIWNG